ncbi:hypothetical protein [Ornithinimicrobium sp. CNJ-824]|uniref:hypothetical protein n=1 Tax=Ornithinimicrobium sp. CNJ-824 TaxID=1904966 RepID=UPI0011813BFA|nr:hypothetical protein [Ornithinimicrobium sp. CNJ-824]
MPDDEPVRSRPRVGVTRTFPHLDHQRGLATSLQLRDAGWSGDAIRHAEGRTIQRVYPGVFAPHRGPMGPDDRLVAAHLWAGDGAVLTGRVALDRYGLPVSPLGNCLFLVPCTRRARRQADVATRRTARPVQVARHWEGLPVTTVAWALCDAAVLQGLTGEALRSTTIAALQRRLTHPRLLHDELAQRSTRGLRTVRAALQEFTEGAWSVPEAVLAELVRAAADLPPYLLNPVLTMPDGQVIGCPDGYFASAGVAVQVHSRQHHSGYDDEGRDLWSATVEKDATYVEHGIVVVPVTPSSIARRPEEVLERIRTVVRQNLGRDLSRIHVRQREIGA